MQVITKDGRDRHLHRLLWKGGVIMEHQQRRRKKRTPTSAEKVTLGDRITELRKAKAWSQSELTKKNGVSYTQMSRCEIKGVQPPANIINKLADALGTSIDFLISGDKDEKVKASPKDAELLQQFKAAEQFSDDDKTVVKKLIYAFIVKKQLQLMAS